MSYAAKRAKRLAQNGVAGSLLALLVACAPGEPIGPSAPLAPPPSTPLPRIDTTTVVWPRLATAAVETPLQFSAFDKTPTDSVAAEADWTATGGTVSASGSFQSSTAGEYFVIATSRRTRKRDSARVTVTNVTTTTITRVALVPDSVSLAPGQTQTFSASGLLASGATSPATFTWSSTGGTVSSAGLFTAGATPGRYRVIATLSGGSLADTSIVTIAQPAPTVTLTAVDVTPATVSLLTGATQQFAVLGRMSDGSSQPVAVTWTASAGSVSSSGLFTAPGTAGTVRVIAAEAGGRADTAVVTVTAPAPTLSSLTLTPASATVVTGGTQAFAAAAVWSDGSTATPPLTWSATGGTVSTAGLFRAGTTTGTYRVIVQQTGGTVADTAVVTVTAPTLTTLVLNPATVTLASGATQQFSIAAGWSDGSSTVPLVTCTATGGTITTAGLYTAGATPGTFRVIASHTGGTRADTSAVTITPTITAVEVTPATATVAAGATQQFTAVARLSSGGTQAVTVTWSATGGTVSASGLFTAGTVAGTYNVIAVQQGATRADTGVVTVTAAGGVTPPPPLPRRRRSPLPTFRSSRSRRHRRLPRRHGVRST